MIHAKVTKAFFDSNKVIKALDVKVRKGLMKIGGRVRKTGQFLQRPSKKSAPPGSPPHTHKLKLLRKLLFFAYDFDTKSVVIGPVLLQKTASEHIPNLLEFGGIGNRWNKKTGKMEYASYGGNPFMGPAFTQNLGFIAETIANSGPL